MLFRALAILCLIWGFNFVVMKTANFYFSPELFVTYRFGLGAIVLVAVAIFSKLPKPPKKLWGWIFLSAVFQISIGTILCQYSFRFLPAGLVSMLNYTMPVWVSILAYFFLSEALTKKKICGIALSVLGVGILMNVDVGGKFSAMLIPLAAAVAWAVGNIIMKAKLSKLNPLVLTTWQMAIGAVLLCIYTFTFGEIEARWTLISVACLLYNGIIASAFAFFLWAYILDNMEASKASISVLGVPVVGVLGGAIFLGEPVTVFMIFGMIMVLSGIFLVQHS